MRSYLLSILTLSGIALAADDGIKAIVPTASTEIGVNPVDLPPASSFVGSIGVNTEYLTELGGTATSVS